MSPAAAQKGRTPFVDGALAVVKGAACIVYGIPTGKSTMSVKFLGDDRASLLVKSSGNPMPPEHESELQALIDAKIAEECPFSVYMVDRGSADALYGDSMHDAFPIPEGVDTYRVQILRDFNINCNVMPVVKHTGLLGSVKVKEVQEVGGGILITFTVHPSAAAKALGPADQLCPEIVINENLNDLPTLKECLPPSGVEPAAMDSDATQQVTPWSVQTGDGGVDYTRLIRQFGCSKITDALIAKMEKITGQKAPFMLRRGCFFSHRDLDLLLDGIAAGKDFYLYTGRGPSSESLHIGHLVPMLFTAELQRLFKVKVVIELTDDEKFLFKDNLPLREAYRLGYENTKDIIACGFDPDHTFIFSDMDYIHNLYPVALHIQKKVTANQARGIFGFNDSDNIGKFGFPAIQASPSFGICFPGFFKDPINTLCLIPQAIDQDPYFRMTRDVAPRLGLRKPALIHSKFIPALQGFGTKMSGSTESTCIYVTDTPEQIKHKINAYAFSGGGATLQEHRAKGANLSIDVPYHYLSFLHPDDNVVNDVAKRYSSGEMLSGEVKQVLIDLLVDVIGKHQAAKAKVTPEVVTRFMDPTRHQIYPKTTMLS